MYTLNTPFQWIFVCFHGLPHTLKGLVFVLSFVKPSNRICRIFVCSHGLPHTLKGLVFVLSLGSLAIAFVAFLETINILR